MILVVVLHDGGDVPEGECDPREEEDGPAGLGEGVAAGVVLADPVEGGETREPLAHSHVFALILIHQG